MQGLSFLGRPVSCIYNRQGAFLPSRIKWKAVSFLSMISQAMQMNFTGFSPGPNGVAIVPKA